MDNSDVSMGANPGTDPQNPGHCRELKLDATVEISNLLQKSGFLFSKEKKDKSGFTYVYARTPLLCGNLTFLNQPSIYFL